MLRVAVEEETQRMRYCSHKMSTSRCYLKIRRLKDSVITLIRRGEGRRTLREQFPQRSSKKMKNPLINHITLTKERA